MKAKASNIYDKDNRLMVGFTLQLAYLDVINLCYFLMKKSFGLVDGPGRLFLITHAQCTMMMVLRGLALLMIRLRSKWKIPCGHSMSRCVICQQIAKPSVYETRQQAKLCRTLSNYITLGAEPGLFPDQSATFVFIGFESRS